MKLMQAINQYCSCVEFAQLVEDTCNQLMELRIDYQGIAEGIHKALVEQEPGIKLPAPEGIEHKKDYNRYYQNILKAVEPVYKTKKQSSIQKGDRVRVVKAVARRYSSGIKRKEERYYFGTKKTDVPINSEWAVLVKRSIGMGYSYDNWGGRSSPNRYETGYMLDTKARLGHNAAFRPEEIQKIRNDIPATLEEFVEQCSKGEGANLGNHLSNVIDVLSMQMEKAGSLPAKRCLYTVTVSIFPEYDSGLRKAFPELNHKE